VQVFQWDRGISEMHFAAKKAVAQFYGCKGYGDVVKKGTAWREDDACIAAVVAGLTQAIPRLSGLEQSAADVQPLISLSAQAPDPFGRVFNTAVAAPGWYEFTTRLSLTDTSHPLPIGIQVDDHLVDRFMVYDPPGAPGTYRARVFLTAGQHSVGVQPASTYQGFVDYVNATYGTHYNRGDYYGMAIYDCGQALPINIECGELTVRGPIYEAWPPPAVARVFTRGLKAPPTRDYAEEIIGSFMRRAYAGPCDAAEIAPFVDLAMSRLAAKKDFPDAIRFALSAVLSSPRFLYLDEDRRSDPVLRRPLSGTELARRLAYFLWSDLPDEPLLASGASGALSKDEELLAQTRRMLVDPRSHAFREAFTTQWLKVDKLDSVAVAPDLFPGFDMVLMASAKQEPVTFFSELLDHDLDVGCFLDCDFAMLDGRLATHYGVGGVSGNEFRRVPLAAGSHRGGILGMASVLIATSNGMVSSPVRRGAFVMERLLGVSPGVPPPNVPALDKVPAAKEDGSPLTPRERLAMHRANASCARCHDLIDPLGVGLENYDAIGAWHGQLSLLLPERTKAGKPRWADREADVRGSMLDGTPYDGPDELKRCLLAHREAFVRSLAEHLTVYALGRGVELSDRPVLDALCQRAAADNDGLATLVEGVVLSELFRTK
jgi:hypothetical protein